MPALLARVRDGLAAAAVTVSGLEASNASHWQLAGKPLGTMEAKTGLHTGVWVCPGVWDPETGRHTGVWVRPSVWIPNWGYI